MNFKSNLIMKLIRFETYQKVKTEKSSEFSLIKPSNDGLPIFDFSNWHQIHKLNF